jgi:hypothetical protein
VPASWETVHCACSGEVIRDCSTPAEIPNSIKIHTISARTFYRLAKRKAHHGFMFLPRDHGKYFCAATTNTVTADDYDKFMKGKPTYTQEKLWRGSLRNITVRLRSS